MTSNRLERSLKATFLGMGVNAVLTASKFAAGILGHSHALTADAVESTADILSSIIVWRGLVVAAEPPDREHPYGHGKAEPLAAASVAIMLFLAAVGTTNRFDLINGQRIPQGNLEIVCVRVPLRSPPPGNGRFDYRFEIAVIGGGIQITQDEFTYLAAKDGYSTKLTFSQKADDPKWDAKIPIPKEYYFKTADGRYGTLFVSWYAAQNSPTYLEWSCSINPSGSRNLER